MEPLLFSIVYLCLAFISLQARQPDISNCQSFHEIYNTLHGKNVSWWEFRIAKANIMLNSSKFAHTHEDEFPGLMLIYEWDAEYKADRENNLPEDSERVIVNIVCEVDFTHPLKYSVEKKMEMIKEIYSSLRDLAKKEINHLLRDENFEVLFYVSHGERIDGVWQETREPVAKWSNGEGIYYAKFMNGDQSAKKSNFNEEEVL